MQMLTERGVNPLPDCLVLLMIALVRKAIFEHLEDLEYLSLASNVRSVTCRSIRLVGWCTARQFSERVPAHLDLFVRWQPHLRVTGPQFATRRFRKRQCRADR